MKSYCISYCIRLCSRIQRVKSVVHYIFQLFL